MMLRKVFFANFLVAVANLSVHLVEDVSEVKSIFCSVVILQPPSLSFCSMFIRLRREVFILPVKDLLQSVLPSMSPRMSKPKKLFLRVELWSSLIEVFAASMSSIKWMITQELFFMKPWSNRLFPSLKLVLFALSMQGQQFWPLQIQ